jgi:hypothetical protein
MNAFLAASRRASFSDSRASHIMNEMAFHLFHFISSRSPVRLLCSSVRKSFFFIVFFSIALFDDSRHATLPDRKARISVEIG